MIKLKVGDFVPSGNKFNISTDLLDMIKSFITSTKANFDTAKNLLVVYFNTLRVSGSTPSKGVYMLQRSFPVSIKNGDTLEGLFSGDVDFILANDADTGQMIIDCPSGYTHELRFLLGEPVGIKYNSDGTVASYGTPFSTSLGTPDIVVRMDYKPKQLNFMRVKRLTDSEVVASSLGMFEYDTNSTKFVLINKQYGSSFPIGIGAQSPKTFPFNTDDTGVEWNMSILVENIATEDYIMSIVQNNIKQLAEDIAIAAAGEASKYYVAR